MFRNGLLVLTSAVVHQSKNSLPLVVQSSVRAVQNLLYVHLVGGGPAAANDLSELSTVGVPSTHAVRRYITDFYTEAARVRQSLEVRFLLGNISEPPVQTFPSQSLQYGYEVVLTDLKPHYHEGLTKYLQAQFPVNIPYMIQHVKDTVDGACNSVSANQRYVRKMC
jgi:hypothetical protein